METAIVRVSVTWPTKRYPTLGTVSTNRGCSALSPRAFRSTETFWLRLPSSTTVSAHSSAISLSLVTRRPWFRTSSNSRSRTFGVSAMGWPSLQRSRSRASSVNGPNT